MKSFCVFLLIFIFVNVGFAQVEKSIESDWIDELVERYAEEGIEDYDVFEIQQQLNDFVQSPLNINKIEDERLLTVLRLSDYQYYNLEKYIKMHGIIQTPQELSSVEGFSMSFVKSILPFISFGKIVENKRMKLKDFKYGKSQLLLRYSQKLENSEEFAKYEGNASAILLKYSYKTKNGLDVGFTSEKDAGESFFCKSNPSGFDFNSFHIFYRGKNILKKLALGDYSLQFGQGLAMGPAFSLQSDNPDGIKIEPYGIKAKASANESCFFRGAALSLGMGKNVDADVFISCKKIDASLSDTCKNIESIAINGYHRTALEISREKQILESLSGIHVHYRGNCFALGTSCYYLHYDNPFNKKTSIYNQFVFKGKNLTNYSIDYQLNYNNITFFGEIVMSDNFSFANVDGLIYHIHDRVQLSLMYKYTGLKYHGISSLLAQSFLSKQKSLDVKIRMLLNDNAILDMSCSEIRYDWLKYQIDAPSNAFLFRCKYTSGIKYNSQFSLLYVYNEKKSNMEDGNLKVPVDAVRHNGRLNWVYKPLEIWAFKTQLNVVFYKFSKENYESGFMISQEFTCKKSIFQITSRIAFFDTDSYNVSIYSSERDVLYAMSYSNCSGSGLRFYLVCGFSITKSVTLYLKYSSYTYTNKDLHRPEIRMQCICKF